MIPRHAELDALKDAEHLVQSGRVKKNRFDLIVLRVGRSGALCESAPCENCTRELANNKIIKINRIYYSTSERTIVMTKFSDWLNKKEFHVSKGWQHLNNKNNN